MFIEIKCISPMSEIVINVRDIRSAFFTEDNGKKHFVVNLVDPINSIKQLYVTESSYEDIKEALKDIK